ncbi:MAG: alanine--tRNA ligase [Acidilobaceae archaeon]|nr:alanine--tRNA ligase [Acidilobaceae archaeon]
MRVSPAEYEVEFFKEMGFSRLKGNVCPEHYWTLNPELTEPQDVPCVEYWFDKIPSREPLSVAEARRRFIEFFKKRGHEEIPPRPVVARWREDLYLTIASIVVFQPHVTSGIVPPPANPLVISQPSIRLEDIDNVGITLGRHLTIFEMAAHHAFNYPDKQVYWKDETVRFAFEFFTKELGIPGDLIVFKESWWEGGGNAGPCFEVAVGGLELATLVFMMYKSLNGSYERIPILIVDTGYGVERISWFSQKSPTAFHAIYGDLVEKARDLVGIERPEESLLLAARRAAGRLDPESPESLESYFARVAKETGMELDYVRRALTTEARLFSVLDHTKSLAFMLADGIVPSNSGEGYLARLVARRTLRQLRLLGSSAALKELVAMQIELWGRDFPRLRENSSYVLEAVELEEARFKELLERSRRVLERELSRTKSIGLEDLVRYYDSYGVHPELVAEIARGAEVRVPHNFYSIVAARHRAPRTLGKQEEVDEKLRSWASQFPATRKLYYEDPYLHSFKARLLGAMGNYVVLDATAFYPTGGGQISDTGVIRLGEREYRVKGAMLIGDVVVHELSEPLPVTEGIVRGEIDWERRYKIMRHHTATHVILGAARRVLGAHVWQAGAEKTEEKGRLDITHHKPLSKEEVKRIEEHVNAVVNQRRKVTARFMDKGEAEQAYGFSLYQGGVPMSRTIRVVEVEGWDVEACGGTHVSNTGEIGGVKIVNVERIQDGVVRLEYVAGTRVADFAGAAEERLEEVGQLVGASKGQEVERLKSLLSSLEELRSVADGYRRIWTEAVRRELEGAEEIGGARLVVVESPELSRERIQEALKLLTAERGNALVAVVLRSKEGTALEVAAGEKAASVFNIGEVVRAASQALGGRGGGSRSYGSARLPASVSAEEVRRALLGALKR